MVEISTVINGIVLLLVAGFGAAFFTRRLDRIEAKLDRRPTREEFDGRVGRIEAKLDRIPTRDEFDGRVGRLEIEVAGLRSDITQIALAVGAQFRPQTG